MQASSALTELSEIMRKISGISELLKFNYSKSYAGHNDRRIFYFMIAYFIALTVSNSSVISFSGAFVISETITINRQATINAGRSS